MWYNNNTKGEPINPTTNGEKEITMAEIKYTARMALTDIINGTNPDKVKVWAEGEIAKLDAKNDKRKNTKSKEQIANEGIMNSIVEYIKANGSQVASALGTALGISTQKASSLCKILVDGGELTVADKKVKGKGSVKEYSLAPTDEVDTDEVAE
jgi:predicted HTH transcriptional regulator